MALIISCFAFVAAVQAADTKNAQSSQGNYQQYMSQYAGQSAQGSKGGSPGGGSQGGNYQQYMDKYAGGSAGGSQKGSSSSGGGGYQQYMQQYAQKGGGDYQQYMKKYTDSSSGGGGYQQYMSKYTGGNSKKGSSPGDYQKYIELYSSGGSSGGGSQGSSGYQQYMQKYTGGSSQKGSSQGSGGYQQYMDKYAGKYMGSSKPKDAPQGADANTELIAEPTDDAAQAPAAQYQQGQPGGQPGGQQQSDYTKEYAANFIPSEYAKYTNMRGGASGPQTGGPQDDMLAYASPQSINNTQDLDRWHEQKIANTEKYVPDAFASYAKANVDQDYHNAQARIMAAKKAAEAGPDATPAANDAGSSPLVLEADLAKKPEKAAPETPGQAAPVQTAAEPGSANPSMFTVMTMGLIAGGMINVAYMARQHQLRLRQKKQEEEVLPYLYLAA